MAQFNSFGGVAGGMSSVREGSPLPWGGMMGGGGGQFIGGMMPGGGYAGGGTINIPAASTVNANNLAYSRGAMGSDPVYKAAQGFLNPNDPTAMYDVAMKGAEHAAGSGIGGSGVSSQYTGRLRQYDIERRAALGNQLLSGAYGRQPAPVNPYAQAQLQLEQANQENRRLLNDIQGRYAPSGGFSQGGGGGGGRSAPMMIGGGGGGYQAQQPPVMQNVVGGGTPAGSNQVANGYFGPAFNDINQRSQFYPGEYAQGTMNYGTPVAIPQPEPTWAANNSLSNDEWENIYAGTL